MKLNRRGSATIVAIIILALVSVGSLGYIGYDKIIKKAEIKDEEKEDKTTVEETKDTNKTTRENDIINTTYGEFVVDYENNKIKITADKNVSDGKTQEVTIPNEKIKKAVFYGTLGCTMGGKYAVILTESGNMYINKYEEPDKYPTMEFIKIDTSILNEYEPNIDLTQEGSYINSVNQTATSCSFASLGIGDKTNELLYSVNMSCDSSSISSAKIDVFNNIMTATGHCQTK